MKIITETSRLILREFEISDAQDFYNLNENPEVIKFTGDSAFKSIDETTEFLKNYNEYERSGYGRWAVILKDTSKFIGFCGLKMNEKNLVDLGFRFFQNQWGKGFATEAALASLEIGFNHFDIDEIIGRADSENKASVKVLEKIGMSYWKYDVCEHLSNAIYYKISKSEFLTREHS